MPLDSANIDNLSSSTVASESDPHEHYQNESDARTTVSGASGQFLAEEMRKWAKKRLSLQKEHDVPTNAWESMELNVATFYDQPFGGVINFIYDILQLSSGRDKFCGFMQGFAKFASASLALPDSERYYMYRGMEDSLSDGRKIFRLFKEFREVYKVRRGFHRMQEGIAGSGAISIAAVCGTMDVLGHTASFAYYLFDNLLWAASIGLLRTKEIPKWQRGMWKGLRRNGKVVNYLGGVARIKWKKNLASIWRLNFAITANVLLFVKAVSDCARKGGQFQGPDDPRLFHTLELLGMAASYRILLSKLGFTKLSHSTSGILAMVAAVCGIWSNWRKVRRKNCGTKNFVTVVEKRVSDKKRSLSALNLCEQASTIGSGKSKTACRS
jgi:hypothetical protein|mmetsp:Transcript_1186/g.2015  ORF Transcript_1186/g.2015 Transcript_1186/m.2015 type:complete len:383 (-) Transcript_1186:100-1248(-)